MPIANEFPEVSVLLALNKIDTYTFPAIDSIVNQKNITFELIVVTNGPDCLAIKAKIETLYSNIPFVTVIDTPVPQLAYALNLALSYSRADYIARMDADDISLADRLRIQKNYMQENYVDVLGTDVELIDENSKTIGKRQYPKGKSINKTLPFRNCFCHPSVMIRKESILNVRAYNAGFNSEDYDLWLRLMRLGVKWDNLDEPLLQYRVHQSSAQGTRLAYAECLALAVREFFLDKSFTRFLAMFSHAVKFLYKKMR